jgi:hypothetical protein
MSAAVAAMQQPAAPQDLQEVKVNHVPDFWASRGFPAFITADSVK